MFSFKWFVHPIEPIMGRPLLLLVVVLTACLIPNADTKASLNVRLQEKQILDRILGKGTYDSRIRPSGKPLNFSEGEDMDGPAVVHINMFIRSISRIDDVSMEFALQITFREEWNDDRLKYPENSQFKFLVLTDPDKIWRPDLFFSNEKEGHFHKMITPNVLLRIYPTGDVLISVRISLVLFCPMQLNYFPLDIQTCEIRMASYGYTTEDLVFLWKEGNSVQITDDLSLSKFRLLDYGTDYCMSKTATGSYSCLKVQMKFKREFSYYLITIYVPTCMLVIVSWVSFWIDSNSSAARVLLGITSLLTMSRQISSINASLPPVSYTKAVDIWTGACLTFVFSGLIEFAVVNYVSRQESHRKKQGPPMQARKRKRVSKWDIDSGPDSGVESDDIEQLMHTSDLPFPKKRKVPVTMITNPNFIRKWLSGFPTRSKRVDVISRLVFPFLFAAFNVFYWIHYLWRDDLDGVDL